MRDLFWSALLHVHRREHGAKADWGPAGAPNIRSEHINQAREKVEAMTNLELLELISNTLED